MDPITIIVTALALGAAAGLKPTAEQAVKDAYAGFRTLIQNKYAQVNVGLLEGDPASMSRQEVVKEDLAKTTAAQDTDLLHQAQTILDTVKNNAPEAVHTIGVNLEDIAAASLRIAEIIAMGSSAVGVSLKGAEVSGDIEISKVEARSSEQPPPKDQPPMGQSEHSPS